MMKPREGKEIAVTCCSSSNNTKQEEQVVQDRFRNTFFRLAKIVKTNTTCRLITAIIDRVAKSNKKTAKIKTMKEEEHPLAEEVHHHEVEHQVA